MNYQEFIEDVVSHISESISNEKKVVVQQVTKNNGMKYDGLVILDPILNISPTIYLNPYYHRYLEGVSLEDIYSDVLTIYETYMPKEDFDISQFVDFEKAKSKIIFKLVNKEKNVELLEDVPYVDFCDLALIFLCNVCDYNHKYGTILIHNQHLSYWNISLDALFKIAQENTPLLLPYRFDNLINILDQAIRPENVNIDFGMYILTNDHKIHGATSLAYPGILEQISNTLNDDLIIIPSSIHEALIIPENRFDSDLSELHSTIADINEIELTDDEVLSDHPYFYKRDTGYITY